MISGGRHLAGNNNSNKPGPRPETPHRKFSFIKFEEKIIFLIKWDACVWSCRRLVILKL